MLSLSKSVRFLPSYAPGNRGTASTNGGLIEIAGFLLWKWPGTLRWHGNSRQYSPKLSRQSAPRRSGFDSGY